MPINKAAKPRNLPGDGDHRPCPLAHRDGSPLPSRRGAPPGILGPARINDSHHLERRRSVLLPLMSRRNAAVTLLAAAAGSPVFVAMAGWPAFADDDAARVQREDMVKTQLEGRGIKDR